MKLSLRSSLGRQDGRPRLPPGRRIYAIGDIHGSAALLDLLVERILADVIERDKQQGTLIVLGDFIDRGADSAAVMRSLFAQRSSENLVTLLGNHESAMVSAYRGNRKALAFWLKYGGVATLASFGAAVAEIQEAGTGEFRIEQAEIERAMILLQRSVPSDLIDWMARLPMFYRTGDYLFVHAGIRPHIRLAQQRASDLLWIRDEFLSSKQDHGAVVVHGHSPVDRVDFKLNRINVDTGAYDSGVLSAVGLEAAERWVIDTR